MSQRIRHVPRRADERLLEWCAARAAGMSCARIAAAHAITGNAVNHATGVVRAADLATHDPRATAAEIRGAYW